MEIIPKIICASFNGSYDCYIHLGDVKYLEQHIVSLSDAQFSYKGGLHMPIEIIPEWMANLDDEDISFIKKFIISSGSLKKIANQYGVTYPTVRLRLDKLIQKIKISEDTANEPYNDPGQMKSQ